jgi:hypothetical protein
VLTVGKVEVSHLELMDDDALDGVLPLFAPAARLNTTRSSRSTGRKSGEGGEGSGGEGSSGDNRSPRRRRASSSSAHSLGGRRSSSSSSSSSTVAAASAAAAVAASALAARAAAEDEHGVAEGALWLSWSEAWGALRQRGWARHLGTGIDLANYYLAPGCPKPRRDGGGFKGVAWAGRSPPRATGGPLPGAAAGGEPVRGRDYFTRPEAVIAHAQRLVRADEKRARDAAATT